MKLIILVALVLIVGTLFMAGRALIKDGQNGQAKTNRMAKALTWRIGLSVALFLIVLFSYYMGWIKPTGFGVNQ